MSINISNKIRFPYLLEDMVLVLMRCLSEPPRLKSDQQTFHKKVEEQLSSRLVEIPPHIMGNFTLTNKDRLIGAVRFLINLRLANKEGISSKSMNLVISELGHKWLNGSTEKKLKTIYIGLQKAIKKSRIAYINTFKFAPTPIPLMIRREEFDPTNKLIESLSQLNASQYIVLDKFIAQQVKHNNPLINKARKYGLSSITIGNNHFIRSEAELELIWADYIKSFIYTRLFALGGITFGFDNDGLLSMALNKAGLFLMGKAQEFSYDEPSANKVIIVQPDFNIIFLSPSPSIESKINPFAEKIGSGIGVLFKITRQSIMEAAAIEMDANTVLDILSTHALQPVSENVCIEIKNWFKQCYYFEGRETYLVKCQDKQTMMRIVEVAGKQVTPVSNTVLELNDPSKKLTFLKRMKDNGIFLK